MEATGADHHAQLEKLEYLTRDLVSRHRGWHGCHYEDEPSAASACLLPSNKLHLLRSRELCSRGMSAKLWLV